MINNNFYKIKEKFDKSSKKVKRLHKELESEIEANEAKFKFEDDVEIEDLNFLENMMTSNIENEKENEKDIEMRLKQKLSYNYMSFNPKITETKKEIDIIFNKNKEEKNCNNPETQKKKLEECKNKI